MVKSAAVAQRDMVLADSDGAASDEPLLHATVYEDLRQRMLTGKIVPGVSLSTRSLALEMGVSQMPIRDALSRLAAEGAVQIRSKRRIEVAPMTAERFADILSCRSNPRQQSWRCRTFRPR